MRSDAWYDLEVKKQSILRLSLAIIICEMAGIIGSLLTASAIPNWYATLAKPALNPPSWIFGPVWTVLYALMGIAAYIVWSKGSGRKDVRYALGAFGLQLLLNASWSVVFFRLQNPAWAFANIVAMWIAIALTMMLFRRISKPAFWLLVPYILWVSFAGYLNYSIWMLNKDQSRAEAPIVKTSSQHGFDGRNSTFVIDGKSVTLNNGLSAVPAAPDSASSVTTRYFGNESAGDLDGDDVPDIAFLVTQETGGSGIFYYVVVARKTPAGYVTTNAFYIGDRIAPQSIVIPERSMELQVNYAERKPGEPMSAKPSSGAVLLLKVTPEGVLEGLMK